MALALVLHIAGGWYFSGVLIEDGFDLDPDSLELVSGDFDLVETTYPTPLGDMDAWFLDAPGTLWVIHVHGRGATPAEAQHLFEPLQEAGYPQLAITYRNDDGQPADPSGFYGYGATEWEDIKAALDYANSQGARGVVFIGFSTGASHVLSYAYKHQIDDIRGAIFDSPNVDFGDTVAYAATQRRMPVLPMNVPITLGWTAKVFTSLRMGVNWKTIDYVSRAESALRVPVLIIHGTADMTVPLSQSIRFSEAAPSNVTLFTVADAEHVGSYDVDPDGYVQRVLDFLDERR